MPSLSVVRPRADISRRPGSTGGAMLEKEPSFSQSFCSPVHGNINRVELMVGLGRVAGYSKCWEAEPSERWRLIAEADEEGWAAIAYDRTNETEAYRELAASEDEAKAKARH